MLWKMLSKNYSRVKSNAALQFSIDKFIQKIKIILLNSTVFRLHVTCETQTFQPDLLRNGQKFEGECLIMPPLYI